jgi:hypothetical protein
MNIFHFRIMIRGHELEILVKPSLKEIVIIESHSVDHSIFNPQSPIMAH